MSATAVDGRPVVLVTGAGRRIGRDIALDLAAHGFDVAVHYRSSADDARATVTACAALGAKAASFAADLSDETACRALVPQVVAHFGRLDGVVNNASTFEYDTVATFSYRAMELHWRANTGPTVLLAQALATHLATATRVGCVVNLLDQKLWSPNPDYFSYTLSKAALETASTMLAIALAPKVRVCGVAPGVTLPSGPMTSQEFEAAARTPPLGRSSTPADIARTVRFMLESPAVTGATLLVDGGQHLPPNARDVYFSSKLLKKE